MKYQEEKAIQWWRRKPVTFKCSSLFHTIGRNGIYSKNMDDDLVWETHAKKSLIKTDPANKNSFSYLCK